MGFFGLTIPEEYGAYGLSKASMCVVSKEFIARLIVVGSLGTTLGNRSGVDHRGRTDAR